MGEFFHALDCIFRPKNSIRSLPTCFQTLVGFIVLRRKKANPYVQNTFKSPVVLLQKIVIQKTFVIPYVKRYVHNI